MKFQAEETIGFLKSQGLIGPNDITAACMDTPSAWTSWGAPKLSFYILAADETSLRFFDIDEKSGQYLGTCSTFEAAEIIKCKTNFYIGSVGLLIQTASGKNRYTVFNQYRRFKQKESVKALKNLVKTHYAK